MIGGNFLLTSLFAFVTALALAFALTPAVKIFAHKIGAIDVPKDSRRMHKVPLPRVGGLAIFLGFIISVLIFAQIDNQTKSIFIGAVIIVLLGVVDDITPLKPLIKLAGQIVAALIPVLNGVVIERLTDPFSKSGGVINMGVLAIPITIIWIVGMSNAVNFIDGLDGLAVGVSSIAAISMFAIAAIVSESYIAIIAAALAGACFGFMPYNINPAKIIMGDTGSLFLGYILAVLSIQGLFKVYAIISFAVPFIVLALPIVDTIFAIVRRIARKQSPMTADKGHVHHRLIRMGFNQKQSVAILYVLSIILGLSAVVLASSGETRIIILAVAVILAFFIGMSVMSYDKNNVERQTTLQGEESKPEEAEEPNTADEEEKAEPSLEGHIDEEN